MFISRDFFPPEEIPPPKDTETPVESPIPISPSSSVGSSSPAAIRNIVADSIAATLEEVANVVQRLIEHVIKHNSVLETNNHKRKLEDRRNTTYCNNNNYRNNDYHQQQNRRQETVRTHDATSTKNKKYTKKKGTQETFHSVQDAPCITQEFTLSSVRLATKWVV
ncbi:hypothetical protein Tco_1456410 [Tanacetum coccineum]